MNIALSFSGGKDSCFALYRLQQQNHHIACLVTTVLNDTNKTVAHDEQLDAITKQAERIGIPIHFIYTDFKHYEVDFLRVLEMMKTKYDIDTVGFGDIYLTGHRAWGENMTGKAGLQAIYPLWTRSECALDLLKEFVALPFVARVTKIDAVKLPENWVGRKLDRSFIHDIERRAVCPMGESGEYHTTVEDGPIFNH